ncbi:MAG: T9SS type A sorting domain-containing protein [Bacteroides sp.]|nr:T9SS type A sorting domain-containing protein [Roseburia sp.]MCM1347594.1 T9SS type A sorting domain-containing protein [Bacteroides sp.]MCM1422089.1 T9SS type A sorting domain-containing protein [Bacteroides sp.]
MSKHNQYQRLLTLLSAFSLSITTTISAQDIPANATLPEVARDFQFQYDADGNRVKKTYAVESVQAQDTGNDSGSMARKMDSGLDTPHYKVSLYPNPTTDIVYVEVAGIVNESKLRLDVYGADGKRVFSSETESALQKVSLGDFPAGLYVFSVNVDGETSSYKVVRTDK